MTAAPVSLTLIASTSPTLAESMRACSLRAGLSRATGADDYVLGSPKGWLGSVYHDVLRKVARTDLTVEPLDDAIERLWNSAVKAEAQRASRHPLNSRFGPPSSWPGYFVARASVNLRAHDEFARSAGRTTAAVGDALDYSGNTITRERPFTAFDGRLVGIPDVIRNAEIVDYKTGTITEYDEALDSDVIKAAYVRQLRIYGFLVKQARGAWPARGVLLPSVGAGVEISLHPADCEREATEAVHLLDSYNDKVRRATPLHELASPSPQACRWCQYKIICAPFWNSASAEWSSQLDGAAISGPLASGPTSIHSGSARAIAVDVDAGSEIPGISQITPMNVAVHPTVVTAMTGQYVRVVGLRRRPDGVLAPTARTVFVRLDDVPRIEMATVSDCLGTPGEPT